jgi:hypothetical protein
MSSEHTKPNPRDSATKILKGIAGGLPVTQLSKFVHRTRNTAAPLPFGFEILKRVHLTYGVGALSQEPDYVNVRMGGTFKAECILITGGKIPSGPDYFRFRLILSHAVRENTRPAKCVFLKLIFV